MWNLKRIHFIWGQHNSGKKMVQNTSRVNSSVYVLTEPCTKEVAANIALIFYVPCPNRFQRDFKPMQTWLEKELKVSFTKANLQNPQNSLTIVINIWLTNACKVILTLRQCGHWIPKKWWWKLWIHKNACQQWCNTRRSLKHLKEITRDFLLSKIKLIC